MLHAEHRPSVQNIDRIVSAGGPSESFEFTFHFALDFLRRQYAVIGFSAALMLGLGLLYLFTAPPSYTATTDLLIDSTKVHLFQQQQAMFTDLPVDASAVESQVEILRSEGIALAVIKKLNLAEDSEFVGPGGGLVGTLFGFVTGLFGSNEPRSEFASTRQAVKMFQNRLTVRRIGLTYIIEIKFRSFGADRAAQIANAVADAYIDDQLESKYQAARRAGTWLQDRLRELREQASTAERAVVDFKNSNNMVDAGGRTINEQQLAELNSQLVGARAQTAEAHARMDRVQAILTRRSPEAAVDATVADTLKSEVINKLRAQYLELARREADWATRYGANHLAVVNLRNQMREIQNSIRDELQRTAETYKNDLEIAKQRQDSVQRELDQAVSQSQVTSQAQVALRELESSAQTYQALYDNFLQRYMESVQQQSFPIAEGRVISAASRPLQPSNPRTLLVLAVATVFGLAIGGAAAAWREITDRVFRTRKQVEELLQTECIALVPAVTDSKTEAVASSTRLGMGLLRKLTDQARGNEVAGPKPLSRDADLAPRRIADTAQQLIAVQSRKKGKEGKEGKDGNLPDVGHQRIASAPGVYSTIIESPFSAFAEAIRSIKVAIDLSPTASRARVIGFTSSVPNEGKSSIAAATARLVAHTGARTLLVDCDLKNPSLSRLLSPRAAAGLIEVVRGQATLEKAIWIDNVSNLKFLPTAMKARLVHSSEILASTQMRKFFASVRHSYDYIFVDFAPLMPTVDVRVSTPLVDSYVFVVEWGKTRTDHVEQALRSARTVYEHSLGVVLNKVDLGLLGRYDGRGDGYYHHGNGYTE